jgi:hypothetical protein
VNGATLAQIWCKITASNDWLSQSICLANLAVQGAQQNAAPAQPTAAVAHPPMDPQAALISWLVIAAIAIFVTLNIGARVFPHRRKPAQRIEPRL